MKTFLSPAHLLGLVLLWPISNSVFAQSCSVNAITSKYWQYRQNLNKHFVLNDINPSGCVGDGIGLSSNAEGCVFGKSGYGIPATSIIMAPNGGFGMGERNPQQDQSQIWKDVNCAGGGPDGGTTYDPNDPPKFNYLEYGSETPHQMGQYWGVLATEYALLKQNHQDDAAQKTLDELFLALQAYRRLDMQAQCLAKKRYDEINNQFQVSTGCGYNPTIQIQDEGYSCLCPNHYIEGLNHPNFSKSCTGNCPFEPELSGYSGFFLREDAVQEQELLHDPSEERWNIDLVSSAYAMSSKPPCTSTFSQTCYLVRTQNFMSQDGVFGLMIGLTLIKRYIPPTAEVTTCDGATYHPLDMAIHIATSITDRIDNEYRNWIIWPGSRECCDERVYLTQSEGGSLKFTMHGLKKVANYMDGGTRHSNLDERIHWEGFTGAVFYEPFNVPFVGSVTLEGNEEFWLRLKSLGWDMGEASDNEKKAFEARSKQFGTEILGMVNNLLYPEGDDFPIDREYFEQMLCSAPCTGPCIKQSNYGAIPTGSIWPDFPCANSPEWVGQRWEGGSVAPDPDDSRLYNGLDYMLLYNVYMLHFPNQATVPYQNPDYAVNPYPTSFFGGDHILGSSTLCKGATGLYEIDPVYEVVSPETPATVIDNIKWTSTSNLVINSEFSIETDVTLEGSNDPSYVEVSFTQQRDIPLFTSEGDPVLANLIEQNPSQVMIPDVGCEFRFRKSITNASELAASSITTRYSNCSNVLYALTDNPELEGVEYHWRVVNMQTNAVSFYEGAQISIPVSNTVGSSGLLFIELTIENTICPDNDGVVDHTIISWACSGNGYRVAVQPNPANDAISVNISKDDIPETIENEKGIVIRRIDGNMNPRRMSINTNDESINISDMSNGVYSIEVFDLESNPVTATFIIQR